jgi:DNA-binding NarL/FixJ family response regulator
MKSTRDCGRRGKASSVRILRESGFDDTEESQVPHAEIRVLVVASIRLYREGLAQALDRREDLCVVGTAADRQEAAARIRELRPRIVLLDMTTPESQMIPREAASLVPDLRVVALGVAEVEADVLACAEAGLAGYVPREASLDDLVAALRSTARGEVRCSAELLGSLWRRVASLSAKPPPGAPPTFLTRREREIARLIDRDLSNKEIAHELGIEVATVKNHIHNLLEKLGVHRRTEAARIAARTVCGT